jgi:cytochrome c oxidase assembly factor CtaG
MCIEVEEAARWWTVDPLTIAIVAVPSAIYARGLWALRRRPRARGAPLEAGHGIRRWEAVCFFLGQLSLALALLSPLDRLSDILFSAHMTQHEIIMLVAPPLLLLGRPWIALLWALPAAPRARVANVLRDRSVRATWHLASGPLFAVVVHALAVWLWHVPSLYEAALNSEWVHAVQHASFFVTAALFWWAMLRGRYGRLGYGLAVAFVFATAMHTSILGALITMARHVWYPIHVARASTWQIDALDDQTMAGLLMWIPAGVLMALIAIGLFAAWLGEAGRRVAVAERRREALAPDAER